MSEKQTGIPQSEVLDSRTPGVDHESREFRAPEDSTLVASLPDGEKTVEIPPDQNEVLSANSAQETISEQSPLVATGPDAEQAQKDLIEGYKEGDEFDVVNRLMGNQAPE